MVSAGVTDSLQAELETNLSSSLLLPPPSSLLPPVSEGEQYCWSRSKTTQSFLPAVRVQLSNPDPQLVSLPHLTWHTGTSVPHLTSPHSSYSNKYYRLDRVGSTLCDHLRENAQSMQSMLSFFGKLGPT